MTNVMVKCIGIHVILKIARKNCLTKIYVACDILPLLNSFFVLFQCILFHRKEDYSSSFHMKINSYIFLCMLIYSEISSRYSAPAEYKHF